MANNHDRCNGDSTPGLEQPMMKPTVLTTSKSRKKPAAAISRAGSEVDDFINLFHGSDPVRVELSRLENEVRDKDRELGDAHAEIKALKYSERVKEKAVEELTDELNKVDEKLKATEALLESKNLEMKKINDEKKAALAAQFAAEATLRRVHAAQKDDEMPPIEAIITPLEAELKLARLEVAKLQDDNRALDRLTKSKEAALLEAERTVQMALAKAALVDDLQNKNQELMKQIEICQEENKILDKMHRQKVAEVEKLTQTVRELEEAVLAGGAAANAVRDYQRKVQEMNEKYQLRFKVLEDKLKASLNGISRTPSKGRGISNGHSRRQSLGGVENLSRTPSNGFLSTKTNGQSGSFRSNSASALLKHAKISTRSFDGGSKSVDRDKSVLNTTEKDGRPIDAGDHIQSSEMFYSHEGNGNGNGIAIDKTKIEYEDYVSGMLYDMLQKDIITLRKACHEKDQSLKDKDDAIEMLAKKVETLNKAMEVEAKKMRREVAAMEKEVAAMRSNKEQNRTAQRLSAPRGAINGVQLHSSR
ncbi:Microtubule-associated protein 70-1 [Camellia lanceoleosa]|uniref:Microtubule-associated protein 70-1 n=1 Tax=Camellia lanceoleosa TaxID=1840588 RepID=A0ACC0FPF0_9ERIC|nr:Microtubule-associated protein 70-1 [Camellia lanceoleosa]